MKGMDVTKMHTIISVFSFAVLVVSLAVENTWVSFALIVSCLLVSLLLLGGNIAALSNVGENNPKTKTLRFVTAFDALCILVFTGLVILNMTGIIQLTDNSESMVVSALVSVVILVLGNICPKLPYNRYTGLRLPWTLADESTWILAHRILGYTSIPLGVCNVIAMFSFPSPNVRSAFAIGTFLLWVALSAIISCIYFYKREAF